MTFHCLPRIEGEGAALTRKADTSTPEARLLEEAREEMQARGWSRSGKRSHQMTSIVTIKYTGRGLHWWSSD